MDTNSPCRRAAAYCRVSTRTELQEGSLDWQKRYYEELLSHLPGVELAGLYADRGSGRSLARRPQFRQLLQDCETGTVDEVFTKSISRFSRNLSDCVSAVRRLRELGIPVHFEKEGVSSLDSRSELLFHILAILAQEESESIGSNMRWSIQRRHSAGIPTGKVTYGYRRIDASGHWQVEPGEARRVKLAFDLAAEGRCYQEIREALDRLEALEGTSISWSQNRNRVPLLLKNISYTGNYVTDAYYTALSRNGLRYSRKNRGERPRFFLEGHHAPLVSSAQFQRVQLLLQRGLLHSGRRKLTARDKEILRDRSWQKEDSYGR